MLRRLVHGIEVHIVCRTGKLRQLSPTLLVVVEMRQVIEQEYRWRGSPSK